MANEINKNFFICRKCFRLIYGINEELFDKIYKGESLCVICRTKGKLTKPEENGLLAETAVTGHGLMKDLKVGDIMEERELAGLELYVQTVIKKNILYIIRNFTYPKTNLKYKIISFYEGNFMTLSCDFKKHTETSIPYKDSIICILEVINN